MTEVGILEWSNLWRLNFLSIFGHHDPFPQDFGQILRRIMPYLIEKTEVFEINYKKVISSCLSNCIFPLRSLSAEKSTPLRKVIIFKYFWQFWSLSPRFWADRERIVPYLTEMVRPYSIVTCPIVLNIICGQTLQAGVLKFKNSGHF